MDSFYMGKCNLSFSLYILIIVFIYIRVLTYSAYAMSNQSPPPIRTCVLRVGIKCCQGCQTKAKTKLLSVSGVRSVEYNAEEGLLTVSGDDVNPTTLLHKLNKWGKNAELVSFKGDNNSSHAPITPEQNLNQRMESKKKEKKPTLSWLLMCFGRRKSSKSKVKPLTRPNSQYRGVGAEDYRTSPLFNVGASPPMVYPPPQAMPGFATPIPYPPPYFRPGQPPPPYSGQVFRSVPPQSPPFYQSRHTEFPHMVNSRLHYPHH